MITVYTAQGILDAYLVQGLLQSEGVPSGVYGAGLQGGIGELPVAGLVTVKVSEAFADRARSIIDDYDNAEYLLEDL